MSLGEKIKKLRKENHLTLEQMANKLNANNSKAGFSKGRLSRWESGKDEPRLSSLKQVAELFNVSIDYFFENKPSKQIKADLDDDDVLFTYQGKPLTDLEKQMIRRLMDGKSN